MNLGRACQLVGLALLTCSACDWDLQRMVEQERCAPMERTGFFRDGSCNQHPPDGVVRFGAGSGNPSSAWTGPDGRFLPRVPRKLSRAELTNAKGHFETFCAPCHGLLADGQSQVAESMQYRKPPSLLEPRIRALPAGQVFAVITEGYGFMPSYAHALSVNQRWALVAYLRALQWSQGAELARLPEGVRKEAEAWLR